MLRRPFLISIKHKEKIIRTSVGSFSFEGLSQTLETTLNVEAGKIPAGYAHRPDLIADLFLESASNWWIFMATNGIIDPFEELNLNDVISLPSEILGLPEE